MTALIFVIIVLVILWWLAGTLGELSFHAYEAICRFLAKPPRIVIPGILAWAASIFLLLLWVGHKL